MLTKSLEEDSLHLGRDRSRSTFSNTPELVSDRTGEEKEKTEQTQKKTNKAGQG